MIDTFKTHARTLTTPPEHAAAVEPDDLASLSHATRALYIGTGGDVSVGMVGGGSAVFVNVPSGTLLPIRVRRILATGTSAGNIVALW